jgi:hypothetical protein
MTRLEKKSIQKLAKVFGVGGVLTIIPLSYFIFNISVNPFSKKYFKFQKGEITKWIGRTQKNY